MMRRSAAAALLLALFSTSAYVSASPDEYCVLTVNGTAFNLTALATAVDPGRFLLVQGYVFEYAVRACSPLRDADNGCVKAGERDSVVCQSYGLRGQPAQGSHTLGKLATQEVAQFEEGDLSGLTLTYSNGSWCQVAQRGRSVVVELVCDYAEPEPLAIDHVDESVQCSYVVRARSRYACPSLCPEGFAGKDCDQCFNGRFGSDCKPCACAHGTCDDGASGTGACSCYGDWGGPDCSICKTGMCTFQTPSAKFVYDLSPLAEDAQDLTTVGDAGLFEYWVNPLAPVSAPCKGHDPRFAAACQLVVGTTNSYYLLGNLSTQKISLLSSSDESSGVVLSYNGGEYCPNVGRDRSVDIVLRCNPTLGKNDTEGLPGTAPPFPSF
jgi:hypothetical protein